MARFSLKLRVFLFVLALLAAGSPALAHKKHDPAKSAPPASQQQDSQTGHSMPMGGDEAMSGTMQDSMVEHMGAKEQRPTTFSGRLVDWLGRWHPSVVHFPISLFIVAGALELYALTRRRPVSPETTRVLVALGSLGAVAAVGLGWMAMGFTWNADDNLHRAHRWLGTSVGVLAIGAWWAHERFVHKPGKTMGWTYGLLLGLTIAAIALNGYLGGALVHGKGHLAF